MVDFDIRKLESGDIDKIIDIRNKYLLQFYPEKVFDIDGYREFVDNSLVDVSQMFLVITSEKNVIGYIWCEVGFESSKGLIHEFEIIKEYRGLGYGKALIDFAEKEMALRGAKTVFVNCREKDADMLLLFQSKEYHVQSRTLEKVFGQKNSSMFDIEEDGDATKF